LEISLGSSPRESKMKKLLVLFFITLLGCGSDSNNESLTPTTQSIIGKYILSDISGKTILPNGLLVDLTQSNISVKGTLNFSETEFSYDLTIEYDSNSVIESYTYQKNGTYRIIHINEPSTGTIVWLTSNSFETLNFNAAGLELVLTIDSGFLGGSIYRGQETWRKVSDSHEI
jgi:hypothetical protein